MFEAGISFNIDKENRVGTVYGEDGPGLPGVELFQLPDMNSKRKLRSQFLSQYNVCRVSARNAEEECKRLFFELEDISCWK